MSIDTTFGDILPGPLNLTLEVGQLRAALETQHATTDALWNECTALRRELSETHAQLARLRTKRHEPYCDELRKEIEALENKWTNDDDDSDIVELVSSQHFVKVVDRVEAERDQARAELEACRGEVDNWRKHHTQAVGVIREQKERITELAKMVTDGEDALAALRARLERVTEAAQSLMKLWANLKYFSDGYCGGCETCGNSPYPEADEPDYLYTSLETLRAALADAPAPETVGEA